MPDLPKYSFYTNESEEKDAIQLCDVLILLQSDIDWTQYNKTERIVSESLRFVIYELIREIDSNEDDDAIDFGDDFDGMLDL